MVASGAGARRGGRLGYWTLISFFVFFGVITWLISTSEATLKMDRLIHDNWVRFGQSAPNDEFVIVGIDSNSVRSHGRWPWSRDDQAQIITNLSSDGARIILVDIVYTDVSVNNPESDQRLAYAIEKAGSVILPILTEGRGVAVSDGERMPIHGIMKASKSMGHVYTPIDSDGIVRRVYLKAGFKRPHWSTLSLVAMESLGIAPEETPGKRVMHNDAATSWVFDYEAMIPFHGPKGTFKTVSAVDVLYNEFEPGTFSDSIVFLGLTASGLGDAVPTPILGLDQPIPGVEVHANVFSALKNGNIVGQVGSWLAYIITGVSILLLLAIYSRLRPRWGLLTTFLLALLPVFISYLLYRFANIWFAPLVASFPILLLFPLWTWHRLEFATRFLRTETNKLAVYDDELDVMSSDSLLSLFENARTHLKLDSWFVFANGELRKASNTIKVSDPDKYGATDWVERDGMRVKSYPSDSPLVVGFNFEDESMNRRFEEFLDNSTRLQRLIKERDTGGTIESLQTDADRLSKQNQRMLQLRVLNDNIFNGSPAGLVVWNSLGEPLRYNDLATEMFEHLDLSALTVFDFFVSLGKDPQRIDREVFDRIMQQGHNWQMNHLQGEAELVIDFNVLGGKLSERLIVASAVDLSEIRRAERLRSELIEYLSHDLKSPLISSLYLVSQEREASEPDEDVAGLTQVETNINRTLKMIDDLLGLTRAENISTEQLQPVFFENLIENTIDQLLPQAKQKNIRLEVDDDDHEVWVNADSSLVERAFINIVGNAIKYSPDGTVVSITSSVKGQWIVTEVVDQGIGIPEDRIHKLFERFHRDPDAQQKFKGTGLGLSLVATVIKQHGGVVEATSIEGSGTTFRIELPIVDIESADGEPDEPDPPEKAGVSHSKGVAHDSFSA